MVIGFLLTYEAIQMHGGFIPIGSMYGIFTYIFTIKFNYIYIYSLEVQPPFFLALRSTISYSKDLSASKGFTTILKKMVAKADFQHKCRYIPRALF